MNDELIKRIDECLMIYSLPAMHDKPVAKVLRDCRAALTKKYVPMTDDELFDIYLKSELTLAGSLLEVQSEFIRRAGLNVEK